jgi:hypothetical protein
VRRFVKIYVAGSCVFTGLALAGGSGLAIVWWLAPGFVNATWSGSPRASSFAVSEPARGEAAAAPDASGAIRAGSAQKNGDAIDFGALEARLLPTGRANLPWSLALASARSAVASRDGARLEAWESLRRPLIGFLNAAAGVSGGPSMERRTLAEDAAIEPIAKEIAARLESLESEYAGSAERILKSLDPSAIARVLLDDRILPDDRARRILARLPRGAATDVIEKLSRLAPARAARLLERLASTKEPFDG